MDSKLMKAKPRYYPINVTIGQVGITPTPVDAGRSGTGSCTVQDVPFLMKRITFGLLSYNGLIDPNSSPVAPFVAIVPDGLWLIEFKSDNHVYAAEPIQISAAFGSGLGFYWLDLPSPVELRPKSTITVTLTTQIARVHAVAVQVLLHGVEPDQQREPI